MEIQWPLMIFTLFLCLGAGVFASQGILAFMGKGKKLQGMALLTSLIAFVIGGIGSFFHLQHWDRIFNGFGQPASGITQELIAIVVFMVILLVFFIAMRRSEDGVAPKWAGVLAIIISVVLVVVMANSYNMGARPIWNTPIILLYYLCNAALLGAIALWLIAALKRDEETLSLVTKFALWGSIAGVAGVVAYVIYFAVAGGSFTSVGYYFDPINPTKPMIDGGAIVSSVFTGSNAVLFWLGVVVAGILIPLGAVLLAKRGSSSPGAMAGFASVGLVGGLVGGICFRAMLYILGLSVFMFY